jgi:biopolymer transport protein ExbD
MKMPIQQGNPDVGFQIAPMIDVVFVILVFFMSLAAQIRIEQILQTKLPGVAISSATTEFVD